MTTTFSFIDVAGYTALTESHGDRAAIELIDTFSYIVRKNLRPTVQIASITGDQVFLVGTSSPDTLLVVRDVFGDAARTPHFPALRAGLHVGEGLAHGGTYYGSGVNVAARIAALAGPQQVLTTAGVVAAAKQLGMTQASMGEHQLKNVTGRVEVFSIEMGSRNDGLVIDPVCRMRVDPTRTTQSAIVDGQQYWFCSNACATSFRARSNRPTAAGTPEA